MQGNEFLDRVAKWEKWIVESLGIANQFAVQALVSNKVITLTDPRDQQALIAAEENVVSAINKKNKR